jgi:hypothetical protein
VGAGLPYSADPILLGHAFAMCPPCRHIKQAPCSLSRSLSSLVSLPNFFWLPSLRALASSRFLCFFGQTLKLCPFSMHTEHSIVGQWVALCPGVRQRWQEICASSNSTTGNRGQAGFSSGHGARAHSLAFNPKRSFRILCSLSALREIPP